MDMEQKTKKEILLSKNLNKLMKARNLSQAKIARILNINKSTLHNYCNGIEPQGLTTIRNLADFFEVTVHELLFGDKVDSLSMRITGHVEGQFKVQIERIK